MIDFGCMFMAPRAPARLPGGAKGGVDADHRRRPPLAGRHRCPAGGPGGRRAQADGAALPRNPYDPDATPLSARVPLLIGSTHHEQAGFTVGQTIADDAALLAAVKRTLPKPGAAEQAIAAYRAASLR